METNRHSIKAYRGETFTVDKVLRNKDGSPYIISNELPNPYLLLSVSSSEYAQKDRIIRNYWLSLENFPRFTLTQPINSSEISGWSSTAKFPSTQVVVSELFNTIVTNMTGGITDSSNGVGGNWEWNKNLNSSDFYMLNGVSYDFSFISNGTKYDSISINIGDEGVNLYYGDTLVMSLKSTDNIPIWVKEKYKKLKVCIISDTLMVNINGQYYAIGPEFAVIKNGNKYIYWDNGWKDYECRFIKTFFSHDTKDWPAQRYLYSMQLAYGTSNREQLEALADYYGISYSKSVVEYDWDLPPYKSNKELYEELVALGHKFPDDYDYNIPLYNVSSVSLLSDSELTIVNYAQGGVY